MGGGVKAGQDGMGRGGDGLGECAGVAGLCRDGITVRATAEFCLRSRSGK
jgi:hypothetical protein